MVRLALVVMVALSACADERTDILDRIEPLASALSGGDAAGFLAHFDKNMSGFEALSAQVNGLVNSADITCSIEYLSSKGDTAELDWYMQISSKEQAGVTEERHETVRVRFDKKKIVSFEPSELFRPLAPAQRPAKNASLNGSLRPALQQLFR